MANPAIDILRASGQRPGDAMTGCSRPIYLDYNATTPVAPEVLDAMLPMLREHFGNPSSSHPCGRQAREALSRARGQVAALIGAAPGEILFTGSATEADNLAILGVAEALKGRGRHLITSAVEHPAVARPVAHLAERGWNVTVLPVDGYGQVSPLDLVQALREDTVLVSVMHANNEVGTLQPIAKLAGLVRDRARPGGVLIHTDAAQSVGKVPVDVDALGVDLLTVAGHKLYAPKGVGALYLRAGTPIVPIQYGAGQEQGLRPGTENIPHIVGLGAAAALADTRLPDDAERLRELRDDLHRRLAQAIPGLALNGHPSERLPNTLHLSFPGVSGRALLARSPQIAASVGSACHEEGDAVSGVLAAMGLSAARARAAVRLSLGEPTTMEEIARAAGALVAAWQILSEGPTL